MTIHDYLQITIDRKASDLHLIASYPPTLRVNGQLVPLDHPPLVAEIIVSLLTPLLTEGQKKSFETSLELDFGYTFGEGRFRINAYRQKGTVAVAFRRIPVKISTIDELNLPPICHRLAELMQGFVLVTGPTGHGKSTTIAAILEEINKKRSVHVLTIEDPIEYIYSNGRAVVSQREIGIDSASWEMALRQALREDPNVVLVGEMRDYETIAAALTIAETGHLVFATLHTNSAAQTVDRIVDVFPDNQQPQVRLQLSNTLEAIISQRLLPSVSGGLVPAAEVLTATPAVRSIIREGKTHLLDNVIQTSAETGMVTIDMALAQLLSRGQISFETASAYASDPEEVRRLINKVKQ